ncbi:Phosphate transport system protein phoU [Suttonella ornithocola]|uniref:Phosphate-specific transport system accessory protein PhoU n=2 Tax=Suttonella ornithocola TaxID=279832 RepID=A0A380MX97_9GAMM|nr:Phosphate transport system protein phoU [Suttonella ornithocola]
MERHTSSRFDEELHNLHNMTMEMAKLCESQLHIIRRFLKDEIPLNVLQEIETLDDKIDRYHVDINLEATRLIAKRAPVAIDLRYISATFRIVTDLERIGDECCKIGRFLRKEQVNPQIRVWREIGAVTRLAKNLLTRTIDMLARSDAEAAYLLINDDAELDETYHSTARLIASYMIEDASIITQSIDVLMAAKALERIGDHCINIAEAIIFAQEGKDIRHQSNRDKA